MNWIIRIKAAAMLFIMLVLIGHDSVPHGHYHGYTDVIDVGQKEHILNRLFEDHTRSNHSHKYTQPSERTPRSPFLPLVCF